MTCKDLVLPLKAMEFSKKGLPPVAGGSLDQSASFIDFVSRMDYEESLIINDV